MAADRFDFEDVDLTNCDREPIHQLGHVQPFSHLMAFGPDWCLSRASQNIEAIFKRPVADLVGMPIADMLGEEGAHHVRNLVTLAGSADIVERSFEQRLLTGGIAPEDADRAFDCAVHRSGDSVIVEIEDSLSWEFGDPASFVRSLMTKLDVADTVEAFVSTGAKLVRQVTGFDRVMVYRFHDDGHGEVVSESAAAGIDSFLGLHYPASDIPKQARHLYLRNPFRIIADVKAPPVPLMPLEAEREAPLDLSLSVGRAVSPIHIEYLGNMGIDASLSISIIVEGKLWGLFACHHHSPILPSFKERTMAELFSQMLSLKLESRLRADLAEHEARTRAAGDKLMAKIAADADRIGEAEFLAPAFRQMIQFDGLAVLFDGQVSILGLTPPPEDIRQIVRRIDDADLEQGVTAINCLGDHFSAAKSYPAKAAGMLAISISRNPRDYVILFRKEISQTIDWAGDPEKAVETGPLGDRLTPRGSFALFREEVRGCAKGFSETEQHLARTLRTMLIEVVLRVTHAAREESRVHTERQDLLIGELNHRVRNILALIRGIIRQSRGLAASPEDYIAMLQGRIEAMSRAHDQITQDNWSPAPLTRLIETEASAYLDAKATRVKVVGEDVLLQPNAFSTMALVFHELMTNSAKYGALSDSGAVEVSLSLDESGDLHIVWAESGGPPVQQPTRRGFGSTILERTVPHDLGGNARLEYRLSGIVARFCIPAHHFIKKRGARQEEQRKPMVEREAAVSPVGIPTNVMIVEDNLIIAMDAEQMLLELGVSNVEVAASTDQALAALDNARPDFVLLDFNLGSDSSTPIADRLKAMDVRFCFATGYGDQIDLPDRLTNVPVLQKPFDVADLRNMLGSAYG